MRDSIIFYRSFYEAINELPLEMQGKIYSAIFEYSLNFNEVVLEGLPKAIFTLIKPQLDANNKRYENGSKGGRKKQEETKVEPKPNQEETKAEPNKNDNVNDNVNQNILLKKETKETEVLISEIEPDKIQEEIPSKKVAQKKVSFKPPDPQEVQNYCDERQNGLNGQEFCDFYESKGWLIGKNKMKDWQAAVRTWEKYRKNENGRTNNGYNPNGKNGNSKVSGTQNIIDGLEYFEFT